MKILGAQTLALALSLRGGSHFGRCSQHGIVDRWKLGLNLIETEICSQAVVSYSIRGMSALSL